MRNKKFLTIALLLVLLNLLAVGKSLLFALSGEDWVTLHRAVTLFPDTTSFFQINKFIGNYDGANMIMAVIHAVFGYEALPYYLISLLLRIAAATTLFIAVKAITKNTIIALISGLLFSSAYAGVQATHYVFNMHSYVSIILLNIFVYLRVQGNHNSPKNVLLQSLIFFMSFFISPHRIHMIVLLLPIIELLRLEKSNLRNLLTTSLVIAVFLLPIFSYRYFTTASVDNAFISTFLVLPDNNPSILFYPLTAIGSTMVSDSLLNHIIQNVTNPKIYQLSQFVKTLIPLVTIILFSIILLSITLRRRMLFITTTISFHVFFLFLLYLALQTGTIPNLYNMAAFFETVIGISALVVMTAYFLFSFQRTKSYAALGLIGLITIMALVYLHWRVHPTATYPSEHRYLIIPSLAFAISLSCLIGILIKTGTRIAYLLTTVIVGLFIITNLYSNQVYFDYLLRNGRENNQANALFEQIKKNYQPTHQGTTTFVFTSEPNESMTLYHAVTFCFASHMVLVDDRYQNRDVQQVLAVDNKTSLIDILTNPSNQELYRYGYTGAKIQLNTTYAFHLKNGQLIDTTQQVRQEMLNSIYQTTKE